MKMVKDEKDGQEASDTLLNQPPDSPHTEVKDGTKKEEIQLVGPLEIFRYSDRWDKCLMFLGTIFSIAYGAPYPLFVILWSDAFDVFVKYGNLHEFLPTIPDYLEANNLTSSDIIRNPMILDESRCDDIKTFYGGHVNCTVTLNEGIYDKMSELAIYFCILGINVLVSGYFGVVCWIMASERQANRIRLTCLYSILSQNIGWFDTHEASEINNRLSEDIVKIQDGIGEKVGTFVQWISTAILSITIGFVYGWKLALVVLSLCLLVIIVTGPLNKMSAALTAKELSAYAKSGVIAEEVFGDIRTVVAFGGQEKEAVRYQKHLDNARRWAVKKNILQGVGLGTFNLLMYICEAVAFIYGGKLHRCEPDDYSLKTILIVFLCLMIGAYSIGNATPCLQAMGIARGAAYAVFNLIQTESPINSVSDEGKRPDELKGIIEFKHVHFAYPARPDVKVLNDVNLKVLPGQTLAVVGASGCGKSTTVQLVLRFYDPNQGKVLLDGCDIKDLNIKWLRKNIGLVSQEPVLFATTIAENIRYGMENVTTDQIIEATKKANAYDFIFQLPDKFDTLVGERGAQLSGGQKQRIAIARALIRDPKILLLDEATSSLDTESESIVQDALDKACQGRATIIIAHRLSTIKKADMIIGFQDGQVMETGTHNTLMKQKGIYYQLVINQMISEEENYEEAIANTINLELTTYKRKSEHLYISEDENKQEEKDEDLSKAPMTRLLKMNAPEWYLIVLGCIASIGAGCIIPFFVILFTNLIYVFSGDEETQKEEIFNIAIKLIVLGCISVATLSIQAVMFGLSGEALTVRLREQTFRAMMKQDISWFDAANNGVGALTTRLSTDASQVQGVTGVRAGVVLMSMTCVIGCLIIGFSHGWKLTLILLAFLPFMAIGDVIKGKLLAAQTDKSKEAFEGAGKITVESIGNIRTVASLSQERTFFSLYMEQIKGPYRTAMRNAHIIGISFSFSQSAMYFFYSCSFVVGAYLLEEGDMAPKDFFRVLGAILMGSLGLGGASAIAPDAGKAQISANRIVHILDSTSSIDHKNSGGKKLKDSYKATVSLNEVIFHYPSRETVPVLQDLNLSVSPGQTLALVGSSGCGKSTTVQLIERFYDTVTGMVCLDNHDIKTLNIDWLRSQIALVPQEPVLFDETIADNIAFGDNSRVVPMEEIVEASRTANIHSFIVSLPNGYDTNVGSKGTQLSGGQKQRIAIARALVRKPRILLLDEATSSLDTESEKVVQEALDRARVGRTCITIAHRLATVKNADKICVIKNGTVTEEGTHRELMAIKGYYNKMIKKSMRAE